MNRRVFLMLLMSLLSSVAFASTKTLTILGGTKIKAEFERGMPRANEKRGVKTEVTGFMTEGDKLIPAMGFSFFGSAKIVYVAVDEVSGVAPVRIVEDTNPKLEHDFWKGRGTPRLLNKAESAWIFERGDTIAVYRFTVRVDGSNEDIVIFQPAVFPESTKKLLRRMGNEKKG